ncbi:MAG TPA: NAD(P)-dependent oxidoreductase [Xanthomonadales bacterium]|nr:NAD(P)-dependent oxidoreductase [Xanthomonadales bacterium]
MEEKSTSRKLAFIGLGVMGYPMAGHLATAGHEVTVYNRTTPRAQQWVDQFGGKLATTPRQAADGCEVVFSCVGADHDLREICLGAEGAFAGMPAGSIFVDHTTTSAEVARELSKLAQDSGFDFVDAPVSGGQAGAENGQLTVMMGGNAEAVSRIAPLVGSFARMQAHMGPSGSGQLTKMVNQICIAGTVQGLAEGVQFAQKAGLDGAQVFEVISKGAAQSWQMENRAPTMLQDKFDFGFAVDWMRKDLGLVLDEARRNGSLLPVAALVDQFYAEVQAMGGGRWDTSSLLRPLTRDNKRGQS